MAKLKSDSILQGKALPLSAGTEVELLRPTDGSHARFEVTWHMPNGDRSSGTLSTASLDLTEQEIEDHMLATDSNGLPLYRNLNVEYIGEDNAALIKGDRLIVREPWYDADAMECSCINSRSIPNSDNRVVVKTKLLKRV
mgnify:CR=1 FL=1|jgi:hypothetical protein